jgi:hypothetical protein
VFGRTAPVLGAGSISTRASIESGYGAAMSDAGPGGISRSGADAEELFRSLTGATIAERAALGDAMVDGKFVEVKKATSTTLNQVRAVKYIPLVALFVPEMSWYVIPANEIVRQCARKRRGQHTENPFESATLSLSNLGRYAVAEDSDLLVAVRAAIAGADRYPLLGELMAKVLADSKALAVSSVDAVRATLDEYGLS